MQVVSWMNVVVDLVIAYRLYIDSFIIMLNLL
jgi:hypothetical protein